MRILLIHPDAKGRVPDTLPIGIGIVQRLLKDEGHEVQVFDIMGLRYNEAQVTATLDSMPSFDLVCISAMSVQYRYVKWLAAEVKERLGCPIILGGCLAKFSHEAVLTYTDVDYCFTADAERYARHLFSPETCPGMVWRQGSNPTTDEPETCDVVPDYCGVPVERYLSHDRLWSVATGRGCSYACDFCSRQFDHLCFRSLDSIAEEMERASREFRFDAVLVADEFALATERRIHEISPVLGRFQPWYANGRINTMDPDKLAYVKANRCKCVSYGVESGSQKILDAMDKRQRAEDIPKVIRWTHEAGLRPNPQLIFGYEGEDDSTIRETMEMLTSLRDVWKTQGVGLGFAYATPLPGSPLYDRCLADGRIGDEDAYLESLEGGFDRLRVNLTSWSDGELEQVKRDCLETFRSYHEE